MHRSIRAAALAAAAATLVLVAAGSGSAATTRVVYDDFSAPYSLTSYQAKWANTFGLGDMGVAPGDTRTFTGGTFRIDDAPFRLANDFSVFDHLKYIAISTQSFAVPRPGGSITFSSVIDAMTPGTQAHKTITGSYGPPGSYPAGTVYRASVFEGQQAGAVMNMVNFATGQLFDWFISGNRAFTLVERLPSAVTGNTTDPTSPDWVGPGKMYTQIVDEFPIRPGPHKVAIRYKRSAHDPRTGKVVFLLDGHVVSVVDHVGLPLDSPLRRDHQRWTHVYPSSTYPGGPPAAGEELGGKIDGFVFGHGTFSLIDAFPYQWGWAFGLTGLPECQTPVAFIRTCDGSVSIPPTSRIFGQGVKATFDDFTVTTRTGR